MNTDKSTPKNKMSQRKARAILGLAAIAIYAAPTLMKLNPAAASGGGGLLSQDPTVVKECSDCHVPYSPKLLSSSSWRKIMGDLGNHFGEDASLKKETRMRVENYLVRNAGRGGDGSIRISQARWFKREHHGDITRHKAKSWSNCMACHR